MTTVDEAVVVDEGWDTSQFANKEHLLRVVRESAAAFFELLEGPGNWEVKITPEWQIGDLAGHMVDVIEGYLKNMGVARSGGEAEPPFGLRIMKERLNERAQALRSVPRDELLRRLHQDFDELMGIFEGATEEEWTGFMPTHPYMGPVPLFCYPAFQLMDYGIHAWDMREHLGIPSGLSSDVADFLVPYAFSIMQGTLATEVGSDLPHPVGFRISGRNASTWKVTVADGTLQYEPAPVDDLPTIFEFDPASFVLTSFNRIRGGTAYGDIAVANQFRGMFFDF
jgi:uncharacterized protein (TIGR03083 family)